MPMTSASVNPNSTQVLGKIQNIFRDDAASYFDPGAITNGSSVTVIPAVAASVPDSGVFLFWVNDATWGQAVAIYMITPAGVYEVTDSLNKFAASDAGTFIRIFVSSGDLKIKNSTGADLPAGTLRVYRIA